MTKDQDLQAIRKTTDSQKQLGYAKRASVADAVSGKIPSADPHHGAISAPVKQAGAQEKVVRETFSMPRADEALIEDLRARAARKGRIASRSEIVRGALRWLAAASPQQLAKALDQVERVKPGRK
jgi:Arc/MetJ-type ribon-helix-helix transcriptional regulator